MPSELTSSIGRFGLIAAGGYAFGPIGAAAGALLGGFLFGSSGPKIEGPRLGDLEVSSSAYGGVIPVGFGVQKVAGAMIWATDIDEDKSTRTEGGALFGGGQKIVEYRYFANFAVAFGEGPAGGVLRIWAGDRLIADLRAGAGAYANHPKYRFRIYLGTEDQEPDRLIREHVENELGEADATPAHRGLVYIVFDHLPLDEFGNRIPGVTAEIAWAGAPQAVVRDTTFLSATSYATGQALLDPDRGLLYYKTSPDGIGRIRTARMVEDLRVAEDELGIDLNGLGAVDSRGDLYVTHGSLEQSFRKIDGDTLQVVASASFSSQVDLAVVGAYTLAGRVDFVLAQGFFGADVRIFFADDLSVFWQGQTVSSRPSGLVAGLSDFGVCEAWFAGYPSIILGNPTATVHVLHVRMELPFTVSPITGAPAIVKPNLIALDASAFGAALMTITQLCYDEQSDRLLFISLLDGVRHLVSYSAASGIVWYVPVSGDLPHQARFTDGKIRMWSGTSVIMRSADDGSLISSQSGFTGTSGIVRFDARTGALYTPTSSSGIEQWLPGRSSDDSALLGDVVTSLCERVGLTAADLDVAELTDEVHGFGIARQISVRGALEMLAAAYAFDAVESDHQLKFKKRGRSPSQVIAEQDLVPLNAEREAFIETRAQEVDLPARFTVVYQDLERDADVGTQYAKRVAGPSSAMHSQNETTFEVPLMLTAAEAKGIALRQLHSAWLERTGYEWRLPWTHVDLEPADVVQVALADGTLLNIRLLETELGANLELAWQTVLEESSSYTVTAVPAGGLNYLPQIDPVSSEARLFLLDVPLILDSDDVGRAASGHYWAAAAWFDPPWRGAVLFSSDDGVVYVAADETLDAVAWGIARTALPDTALPFQTDTVSALQVTMVSGSLASVSNLEMLNGANLAALIRADGNVELIQFQDTALSEGINTLTTLLRGRRGTEVFTGGHAVGDLFVLLDGAGVTRRPLGLDRLGDTLHYRAVGRGGELRDARTEQLTLAGNDLKPYAPAQIEATGNCGSDVTLSWQRRTRVAGELIDGSGEVPLAEDSEQYDLEILLGNAVARVVNGLTSPSYVYAAADQATDFPGFVAQGLSNPGFETGDLSGWTVESGGTWTVDDAHENLGGGHTGSWFVRSTGDGVLTQTLDLSSLARQIDLGGAQARARCWLAETASDTDQARMRLQFLDASDIELGVVDPAFTDPTGTTFVQIEALGAIPVGTRRIKVRLDVDRVSGASANLAIDDVTLEIDPGDLRYLTFAVWQVSAQVGRGFARVATVEIVP
jgi:hypothetical protein